MKEIIINALLLLIIPIILGIISYAITLINKKIAVEKAKAVKENNESKLKALEIAENTLNKVVEATVGKIEQTTAADLREEVKAGTASFEDLKILSKDAYYEILDIIQTDVLDNLAVGVKDYEQYILNKIENQVLIVKQSEQDSKAENMVNPNIIDSVNKENEENREQVLK